MAHAAPRRRRPAGSQRPHGTRRSISILDGTTLHPSGRACPPRAPLLRGTDNPIAPPERTTSPRGKFHQKGSRQRGRSGIKFAFLHGFHSPSRARIRHPAVSCTIASKITFAGTLREGEIADSIASSDVNHLRCEGSSEQSSSRYLHKISGEAP